MSPSPYDPPTTPDSGATQPPSALPKKPWGLISLVLCAITILLLMGFMITAAITVQGVASSGGGANPSPTGNGLGAYALVVGSVILLGMATWTASVVFGILGRKTAPPGSTMAIISLVLDALVFFGFGSLVLIGLLMG